MRGSGAGTPSDSTHRRMVRGKSSVSGPKGMAAPHVASLTDSAWTTAAAEPEGELFGHATDSLGRRLPRDAPRLDNVMRIPRLLLQTAPPSQSEWGPAFNRSYGSWQRHYPTWEHVLLNYSIATGTPSLEPFVEQHTPWFLPAWRRLCHHIMRLDAARYIWMFAYGGVYVDLDLEANASASRSMDDMLIGADVALIGNSSNHALMRGWCWLGDPRGRRPNFCGTHLGNAFLASVPRHAFWLRMLHYIASHVDPICERRKRRASRNPSPFGTPPAE